MRPPNVPKSLSVFILISCGCVVGQAGPSAKQLAQNSPCSNVVALAGDVKIDCSNLTPTQQKLIETTPALLRKILANRLDPQAVMTKLDELLRGISDIQQLIDEQAVPHIQPELVIDSVGADSLKFHISLLNISGGSLADVRLSQVASRIRNIGSFADMLPATSTLPPRGRVSIPGLDSLGLFSARQLLMAVIFTTKIRGTTSEFFAFYVFDIPELLAPTTIDPRSFFEKAGGGENVHTAMLNEALMTLSDEFAMLPGGTVVMSAPERREDSQPNYITIENDTRAFLYDPLRHVAWFRSQPANDPMVLWFEPQERHKIKFAWDPTGPVALSIDEQSIGRK